MKTVILFIAIILGLECITSAQTSGGKQKIKIERPDYKQKIKSEGSMHSVLFSSSSHPAYVRHYTRHARTTARHASTTVRHTGRQVTHKRSIHRAHAVHYKKIKRVRKNGEYKVKYKT
jgi:hypothetical protein